MRASYCEKAILHADTAIIRASIQADPPFPEAASKPQGQILHAGLADALQIVEGGCGERIQPVRIPPVIIEVQFDLSPRITAGIDRVVFERRVEWPLVFGIVQAAD